MERVVLFAGCLGVAVATINETTPEESLRKSLHGPISGKAPTKMEEALVAMPGSAASHFQKLPGE